MSTVFDRIHFAKSNHRKSLAILVDPDKTSLAQCEKLATQALDAAVDYFFVGSSILTHGDLDACVSVLKKNSNIPVILFPGNTMQISEKADAILFLSLISGRNPEMLIGRHVITAPLLKRSGIEILPTGYMLIDSGSPTSVSYMSNTFPIPHDKDDIAACTALAGEMLGLKIMYMDAGSGARFPVSKSMITTVRNTINTPLIVGGGIRTAEKAIDQCNAGADIIVVGNAIEKEPSLIAEMAAATHSLIL
ncbi:MAG: geranylgeranylglyceryl/heptaprenylglyceryl phosphate synthase [Bacteroidetes bacterium]|nr:geranylgeranylglyceryl/heptaprenylglyceryl phosphate synthase [Bacteroidota bacterium]MBP6401878.1 geranylgeranylglyceryl/heptaprenylglyceryl phosphate synthase [Bacteroidia bacterium]MBK6838106.1 geranylgeranylglyceryl/heptaprenylglyceryl phosphate synthase [Bacteroidota bacterium]MBK9525027.1 geranylgeranylglyceryl/heptaprenylglyceryl phosphate synthase [Bacteroidota bacterium]MBK9543828.1 geranylgeranylglyceryl/heptaprenylglyceryl phosphate synthase [Bacteroidota bacterium]